MSSLTTVGEYEETNGGHFIMSTILTISPNTIAFIYWCLQNIHTAKVAIVPLPYLGELVYPVFSLVEGLDPLQWFLQLKKEFLLSIDDEDAEGIRGLATTLREVSEEETFIL